MMAVEADITKKGAPEGTPFFIPVRRHYFATVSASFMAISL